MKLTYHTERQRFEAESEYSERPALKAAGFAWDGVARRWHADHWKEPGKHSLAKQSRIAAPFVQFMDDAGKATLDKSALADLEREAASLTESRATDANVELVAPKGLSYLPYQKAGILYALRAFGDIK